MNCDVYQNRITSVCVASSPAVYGVPCGVPLNLIPIVQAPSTMAVPCPCGFTYGVLSACQMALDGQSSFTESDTRRFGSTLRFLGVTNCTDVIDRPDLWVKALELSIPRAGENFKETYIELLVGARVTP